MTRNPQPAFPFTRRALLAGAAAGVVAAAFAPRWLAAVSDASAATNTASFPLKLTNAEWRKRLSPEAYDVLRQSGTERPFTSALLDEHRHGTFICAGCDQALFASDTKFDSGTGWPSFWAPLAGALGEVSDRTLGMSRTAVHCSRCGGHLGHLFNDGPKPTGLRYCMNGVAMAFRPSAA